MECTKYKCIHNSFFKSLIGSLEAILHTKILKTYKKISLYICPSRFIENKLLEADNIYKGKTVYLQNFIEKNYNRENNEKDDYVLYFGRISEEKGIKNLLEICKELKNIQFKIAGMGPLEEECKNIPNVQFEGFKTGKELDEIIKKAKFVVYPSIWFENCPLSVLEAESLGTPVLTVNYGGTKELVEENITGLLIDKVDKQTLKTNILKMYNDGEKLKRMSYNCLNKKMHTLEEYSNYIEEIYKKVLQSVNN